MSILDAPPMELKLLDVIKSKIDATVKYVFLSTLNNNIIEVAYINKNDGKDIMCVSTQTSCNLACRFCHTTDYIGKLKVRDLLEREITGGISYAYNDLGLDNTKKKLLVSFMGCGEPVLNFLEVYYSMLRVMKDYPNSRFAIATLFPKGHWVEFYNLANYIIDRQIPTKLHLSLHFVNDELRQQWMPNASPIKASIAALEWFAKATNNSVEIHYAVIDDVNDSITDMENLVSLIQGRDIPVKFLKYNEKPTLEYHSVTPARVKHFQEVLDRSGIFSEYYEPPGIDVGASCGQFLMEYYLKYGIALTDINKK